ncbi:MAG TPA: hypothetical protein VMM58_09810 [Bacteroidota bacterium]|nr:hypothetical protein [Bacteroidota bacterium]
MAKANVDSDTPSQLEQRKIEIYKQDSEFCRHQDNLTWSRFRTAVIIEAGLLMARFFSSSLSLSKTSPPLLGGQIFLLILITGAALLTLIFFSISLKDHAEANRHIARIRLFESDHPLPSRKYYGPSGSLLMFIAVIVIAIVNVVIIISLRPLSFFAA